ncbi:hypothetical protein B0H21DRAFT_670837, partial [Amylocystis lapponica]
WTADWKKMPSRGRFAAAFRLPPQTKPHKAFLSLPREVFGRVLQCLTDRRLLGAYYSQSVPSERVDCPGSVPARER